MLAIVLMLTLPSCSMPGGDDLLRPPKPPVAYNGLYESIGQTLASGAVYAPPARGENRQNIHLADLDNDGRNEALAFLKFNTEPLLRIHIYAQDEDEVYNRITEIPVTGESIDRVTYADLNGYGFSNIVVGYRLGAITGVSVYAYAEGAMTEVYTGECSSYTISDLDSDGIGNLLLISLDAEQMNGSVRMLWQEDSVLSETVSAPLSSGVSSLARVTSGLLSDGKNALFLTGYLGGSTTTMLTDIFVFKNQSIENITMDPVTGASDSTICLQSVFPSNIDSDRNGITDVPYNVKLPAFPPADETVDPLYIIQWYRYNSYGRRNMTLTTYHTSKSGWYWVIPNTWASNITVDMQDMRESRPRERVTVVAFYNGPDEPPDTLVTFYTISPSVGETVDLGDRIKLYESADTVVAAEITPGREAYINENILRENFYLKPSEWQTGVLT